MVSLTQLLWTLSALYLSPVYSLPSSTTALVPITVKAPTQLFRNLKAPKSQLEVANFVRESFIANSNASAQVTIPGAAGVKNISATWNVFTKVYIPKTWNGVVQILVHG